MKRVSGASPHSSVVEHFLGMEGVKGSNPFVGSEGCGVEVLARQ